MNKRDRKDLISYLGESIHSGFRKAVFGKDASKIWDLISKMDCEDWCSELEWIVDCLEEAYDIKPKPEVEVSKSRIEVKQNE